ncbi:MAG: MFS transporter [Synergistes sp.]|nr:MFS transporter [Synergistes sp.]
MKKNNYAPVYFSYALLVIAYFMTCLIRTSAGVLLPGISQTMGFASAAVGLISGMYFYGYTVTQPFCGRMCDNKGPIRMEIGGLALFACGLLLFALAKNVFMLCVARFLLGIGAGPAFCGIMVFQARALPSHLFSKFMGFTIMFGHLGGVVAVTPLGYAVDIFGYKAVHYALVVFVLAIAFLLIVMNRCLPFERAPEDKEKDKGGVLEGFRIIYGSRKLLVLVAIWSVMMILQMNLVGLWGVSWISDVCSLSKDTARNCVSMGGIGVLAGACLIAGTGNRLSSSVVWLRGFYLLQLAGLALLILGVSFCWHWTVLAALMFVIGMALGLVNVLSNVFVYKIAGGALVGTVIGACNVVLFLSVLLSQWFSGAFIQKWTEMAVFPNIAAPSVFFMLIVAVGLLIFCPFLTTGYDE